jgi:predicted nuclease of restriction endonuclease-like (RecB) superfamily
VNNLPIPNAKLAQELIKENYDLSFISLPEEYDENALEDAIERRMTRFLLELGNGWAFVGRQKEIVLEWAGILSRSIILTSMQTATR